MHLRRASESADLYMIQQFNRDSPSWSVAKGSEAGCHSGVGLYPTPIGKSKSAVFRSGGILLTLYYSAVLGMITAFLPVSSVSVMFIPLTARSASGETLYFFAVDHTVSLSSG